MAFGFIFYDLTLLILFTIAVMIFLYVKRKNLIKEGLLYLYKTKVGLNIINKIGSRYKKTIKFLSYISITLGYFLMISFTYLIIKTVYYYIKIPQITELIKAPPLMLLIPYFPTIFGAQEYFPNFYFIYFIIAIAIVAIVHEGAHGIFAKRYGIKIKSTGFGFLGPILAFFVEQDEKQMNKAKIFPQLSVLSAGVFANILTAIIFFFLFLGFFNLAYVPAGIEFNNYAYYDLNVNQNIDYIKLNETINLDNLTLTKISVNNSYFWVSQKFFEYNFSSLESSRLIRIYQDQPAIISGLKGDITAINNISINNPEELRIELNNFKPYDEVIITTKLNNEIKNYKLKLGYDWNNKTRPVLGIEVGSKNQMDTFKIIEPFKKAGVAYTPKNSTFEIIYYLIGWIVLINFLVAFFNMLPVGIFDGGRFFYLTILGITKNKKWAENSYKLMTKLFLYMLLLIMVVWAWRRFF